MHALLRFTLGFGLLLTLGACATPHEQKYEDVRLNLSTETKFAKVDQPVRLTSTVENLPKEARVIWTSPDGSVTRGEDGRSATIVFHEPGNHEVTARAMYKGREVRKDTLAVFVQPEFNVPPMAQ